MFITRRLLQAVPILFGVSVVVFGLVHTVPGSPTDLLMPPEVIAQMKTGFGLGRPLYIGHLLWLGHALTGDFCLPIVDAAPVWGQLIAALDNRLLLAVLAARLGLRLGIAIGLIAGFHHNRRQDKAASVVVTAGVSMPRYRCAVVMVLAFSVLHDWLPALITSSATIPRAVE